MNDVPPTPLLAPGSPLDERSRALVRELAERERQTSLILPTDDPLDPKRRRRVGLTRPEIWGQPDAIATTLAREKAAIDEAAAAFAAASPQRIYLVGCGDSLAVAVAARELFEAVLRVPCAAVQALDFAYYRTTLVGPDALVVVLSSSGASTRTVEALLVARALGAGTVAISNTPGSALMAEAERALRVHAERNGWPTQASTAALAVLAQFGLAMARARGQAASEVDRLQAALDALPEQIAAALVRHDGLVADIASREAERQVYLYAGGGPAYAAAMFGAAKLKECTPDRAVAIPLEEFHHYNSQKRGDPLFLVAPRGRSVPRARDTAVEGRRVGGTVYAVATEGAGALDDCSDAVVALPAVPENLAALLYSVPLQLFAYHVAVEKFRRAEAAAGA